LNSKFVDSDCHRIPLNGKSLKYPTGENVPVKFRTIVRIRLGQHALQMLVFVADIIDDCILGCDFLNKTKISDTLNKIFTDIPDTIINDNNQSNCSRISSRINK
jgi:hypothetical protein